ncbi:MAG: hypothetical protein LBD96_05420 [Treponema sp.]|jgi:hypothetical protein|nr:hypothetical protein [Treponema sp.]
MKYFLQVLTVLSVGFLCSCVGLRSDIVLNADGTGRISLEYRISRQFEAIGALDGNTGRPTVPAGRADFERSIKRLEGLTLSSFSSAEEGRDLVNKAVVSFTRLENILPLLDSGGGGATLSREGDRQLLRVRFDSARQDIDPQLLALVEQLSLGYTIALSLSAPGDVKLRVKGDREDLVIEESGRKAGFSLALSRFFRPGKELELEFVF